MAGALVTWAAPDNKTKAKALIKHYSVADWALITRAFETEAMVDLLSLIKLEMLSKEQDFRNYPDNLFQVVNAIRDAIKK